MKNTHKHNTFEEQFKRKFEGAKLPPPNSIWATIEKTLPKPIVIPFYNQNWFRVAATIVLVLGLTTWFTYPKFSNKTENISHKKEEVQQVKELKSKENQTKKLQKIYIITLLQNSENSN